MSNNYAPGYPINMAPGPVGDTVKGATEKHIAEFLKAYADMTAMYQQIIVELKYADVDMVDGKHADNTPNNIPVLNSSGELTCNVNTEALTVSGLAKIAELEIGGENTSSMFRSRIKVDVGVVANGQTIPLPQGFTQEQCVWWLIPRHLYDNVSADDIRDFTVYAKEDRVAVVHIEGKVSSTSTATYVIIGIK